MYQVNAENNRQQLRCIPVVASKAASKQADTTNGNICNLVAGVHLLQILSLSTRDTGSGGLCKDNSCDQDFRA